MVPNWSELSSSHGGMDDRPKNLHVFLFGFKPRKTFLLLSPSGRLVAASMRKRSFLVLAVIERSQQNFLLLTVARVEIQKRPCTESPFNRYRSKFNLEDAVAYQKMNILLLRRAKIPSHMCFCSTGAFALANKNRVWQFPLVSTPLKPLRHHERSLRSPSRPSTVLQVHTHICARNLF